MKTVFFLDGEQRESTTKWLFINLANKKKDLPSCQVVEIMALFVAKLLPADGDQYHHKPVPA
jgi:hypothetical protein